MSSVTPVYTSCACNRFPSCADWGFNDLIIYAACNSILVYRPDEYGGRVIQSLVSHKKFVTSVHWIHKGREHENELLSTSADTTSIIWSKIGSEFVPSYVLKGHNDVVKTGSVLCVDQSTNELLVATTSVGSTVKIWRRINSEVNCIQTLSFGNGLALAVELSFFSTTADPLLALGRDDCNIHLYVWDKDQQFTPCAVLSGHENWAQGLDIIREENDVLWLASASQDSFIRIWKLFPSESGGDSVLNDCGKLLKLKEITFENHSGRKYTVTLESVLPSHDNAVYSVKWGRWEEKVTSESLQLLSSSMDRTMIIWKPGKTCSLWIDETRVGEVGGNLLGFYGGVFGPDGRKILAHGFQGSIHIWTEEKDTGLWNNGIPIGGHFGSVRDIAWDPEGAFLLSCSHDQTTRLHAPVWKEEKKRSWHEISRPQVHGYDIVCLSILDRFKFVSGSDEKVLRVFNAPKLFAENLKRLCNVDTTSYIKDSLPEGASVPALGLTNKAIFEEDLEDQKSAKGEEKNFAFEPVSLQEPPTEEVLLQNTLWPEDRKLYGHPYELFSLTANHKKTIVASACKAAKAEHAAIMLWDSSDWKRLGKIVSHALTVTQMEFSPNDEYLLSVSRDRSWALYKHTPDETPPYKSVTWLEKKEAVQSRIIWSCSWSHDSKCFATASRNKSIAIWMITKVPDVEDDTFFCAATLQVEDSATAVCFAPCSSKSGRYILAIGLENGKILIYTWSNTTSINNSLWNKSFSLDQQYAHHLTVNRLQFSPVKEFPETSDLTEESLLLASCGSDSHVRITSIPYNTLR